MRVPSRLNCYRYQKQLVGHVSSQREQSVLRLGYHVKAPRFHKFQRHRLALSSRPAPTHLTSSPISLSPSHVCHSSHVALLLHPVVLHLCGIMFYSHEGMSSPTPALCWRSHGPFTASHASNTRLQFLPRANTALRPSGTWHFLPHPS